jgi:hypothetical protein
MINHIEMLNRLNSKIVLVKVSSKRSAVARCDPLSSSQIPATLKTQPFDMCTGGYL